jgi:putative nucleotidyltransferase with HDIG domain
MLRDSLECAFSLKIVLDDPALKRLVSGLSCLPNVPSVYFRLMEVLGSLDVSPEEVGEVISQDIVLTAKVLQLVNSARFGMQRQISSPTQAVIYLGPEAVRQLVLVASAFGAFRLKTAHCFSIEQIQSHSLAVGRLGKLIARSLKLSAAAVDYAFVGGLLHDIGKLLLACNYAEQYERRDTACEQRRHATSHGGIAGLWNHPRGSWHIPVVVMGSS